MTARRYRDLIRAARHTLYALRELRRSIIRFSPDAFALRDDPTIAERIETWPIDHEAAEILTQLVNLRRVLVSFLDE